MNETVLVVEDEERIRELIKAYLIKDEYNVLTAENGYEALKIIKNKDVHIAVIDVMMPVMDGWMLLNEIRKTSTLPVIMLTAKSDDEDKLLGFELGTDIYLTKPISPKIIAANIKALLKRTYYIENSAINAAYDDLYIDEDAHRVLINKEEVLLSPKEYDILLYLFKNKGITISREKILDKIWGIDYDGDIRTVDTHVKRLREKLGDKGYLITTVRGYGYKFEVKNDKV
ncbi:DNA-binding response regulator, OmpR family, contains REC and winged-helix (wHTH) domain [Caloramator quimbayensis]|uniref:Stage 0 sporulation protein A homolog n=1 Tax=Caloramator quimbayensis TaxID=1147123 RepID=A0A1T4XZZ9_9CLOT|nr:response regulator transcription factor [Caloramator quimbayensis]SKA95154.1 DNA-binding response regulator, OmpR family, contains REC and winged-helix (wHTH) domain [Caloramator quimbayensis]